MESRQRIERRQLAEHIAIAERVRADPQTMIGYARGNADRWAANYAPDRFPDWLIEWSQLLTGPLDELLDILAADNETAARLRTTSPFVGLLTFDEKLDILRQVDPEMARSLALSMLTYGLYGDVSKARARR